MRLYAFGITVALLICSAQAQLQDHLVPVNTAPPFGLEKLLGGSPDAYASSTGIGVSRPTISGSVVGIKHVGGVWNLAGEDSTIWMDGRKNQPPSITCVGMVSERIGKKILLFWRKALSRVAPADVAPPPDAGAMTLVHGSNAGMTYGNSPQMSALGNVVGLVRLTCTSGKVPPELEPEIDQLLSKMGREP